MELPVEDAFRFTEISAEHADKCLEEVLVLFQEMDPSYDTDLVRDVYNDVLRLFRGEFPGYQKCNTRYHDLAHTLSVSMAMTRLMHGACMAGRPVDGGAASLGFFAALFHDIGYIQAVGDNSGSGAKYTIGHEERGIKLMESYLGTKGVAADHVKEAAQMIRCTDLGCKCNNLMFETIDGKFLALLLGSADLLAQLADRYYLEKLFYLYREFTEADIPGFDSELDMLSKTRGFYEQIATRRLEDDLQGVHRHMKDHFRARWGLDTDPYQDAIVQNLDYLDKILERWQGQFDEMLSRRA